MRRTVLAAALAGCVTIGAAMPARTAEVTQQELMQAAEMLGKGYDDNYNAKNAAGMAALLSIMSSAANMGSAGAIIIAGSGLPPRSARGRPVDDITGNKAVRELIAKSKPNYY